MEKIFDVWITCVSGTVHHFIMSDQRLMAIRHPLGSSIISSFHIEHTQFSTDKIESIKAVERE